MVSSVTSALILSPFLNVTLFESGTRNAALLDPWLNNTEVYFTPCSCISSQIMPLQDNIFLPYKGVSVNNIYWINCMSYNNCTYKGIRKQVTQHLYKFFSHRCWQIQCLHYTWFTYSFFQWLLNHLVFQFIDSDLGEGCSRYMTWGLN